MTCGTMSVTGHVAIMTLLPNCQLKKNPTIAVSGQISAIIRLDIRYFPAGYPVLSGQISGIIWLDIWLGN